MGLALGVLGYFQPHTEPSPWVMVGVFALSIVVLAIGWRHIVGRIGGCVLLTLSLGFLAAWSAAHRQPPMPELPRRAVWMTGRVQSIDILPGRGEAVTAPPARRVTLSTIRFLTPQDEGMSPLRRTVKIRLRDDDPALLGPGDLVRVRALLRAPPFPALPGGRDMQREAWFAGLAGSGRALNPVQRVATLSGPALEEGVLTSSTPPARQVERTETSPSSDDESRKPDGSAESEGSITRAEPETTTVPAVHASVAPATVLEHVRERIRDRIAAVLPSAPGAIATTLLAGLSSALPATDRTAFAASGLSHLLAVAGLHLGIVMGLAVAVARMGLALWPWAALHLPCKQIAAGAGLLIGAVYVALTGLHLPALRSLAMAALVVLALVTGRQPASMRGLATAAALLLLAGPEDLLEVPFQMSFAAVMALIAGYEVLRVPLLRLHGDGGLGRRFAVHVVTLCLTSLLAGTATLPVSMAHFGEIQPFFVVANMVAVPLTALWVMPFGLLSLGLMPLHLEPWTLRAMGAGIDGILWLARTVAAWPEARIVVPMTPGWGLAVFLLGLCWLCLWSRRWRLLGLLPMAVGFASPFLVTPPDIVVAPDGGVIGVRNGGVLYVGGRSRDAWTERQIWAEDFALPLRDLPLAGGETPDGALTCGEDGASGVCVLSRAGHTVLIRAEDRSDGLTTLPETVCAGMDLFLSVSPARQSCPNTPMIDRFSVWRDGAQAVWMRPDGLRVISDRSRSGERLWVMRAGGHGVPNLPMAEAE